MASNKIHLHDLPIVDYARIRPQLQTGDLVIAEGRYFFSRLIQWATRSKASHAGILYVVPEVDRVLLWESVETQGTRFAPFSRLVWGTKRQRYKGAIAIFRPRGGVSVQGVKDASAWAMDRLTVPYSVSKIAYLALRLLFRLRWLPKPPGEEEICSEAAAAWYARARVSLPPPNPNLGITTPADLLDATSVFSLLGRVV